MQNDHELIREYQEGRNTAFDKLVRRHLSNTVGFFFTITRNQKAAEDLAQDLRSEEADRERAERRKCGQYSDQEDRDDY